jgi:hypothetical protein
MKFGVEIELGGFFPGEMSDLLAQKHIKIVKEDRDSDCACEFCRHPEHQNPESYEGQFTLVNYPDYLGEFTIKPEASVQHGFELTTPILSSVDDLKYFDSLLQAVQNAGAKISRECGIHIHIATKFKSRVSSLEGRKVLADLWGETTLPVEFQPNSFRKRQFSLDGIHNQKHSCINYLTRYDTLEYRFFDARWDLDYISTAVEWCQEFSRELNRRLKAAGLINAKGEGVPTEFKRSKKRPKFKDAWC